MKQLFRLLLTCAVLAAVLPAACAQSDHLPQHYYKRFTGTVAGQPVTAFIQRAGSEITAWYAYNRHGEPIGLYPAHTSAPDSLLFQEGDTSIETGQHFPAWKCLFKNGQLTGIWTNADGTKSFPVMLKEDYSGGAYPFDVHVYNEVFDAFPGKEGTPQYEITDEYLSASGKDAAAAWLNGKIKEMMGWDSALSFDDGLRKQVKAYLKDYRDNMSTLKDEAYSASMNWESTQQLFAIYNGNGYVVLENNISAYSGGAHGNYAVSYECYDVLRQKHLRLSDIVSADSVTLQGLLEAQFREDYSMRPSDSLTSVLFENRLPPNNNFYFTAEGLGFAYSPYEIAAYAEGEITVLIPYEKLKGYLNPAFITRIKQSSGTRK